MSISITKNAFGYIYLIREREFFEQSSKHDLREFLNKNEKVYKHGKTCLSDATLLLPRLKQYKKGSELVFVTQVPIEKVNEIESSRCDCPEPVFTQSIKQTTFSIYQGCI